MSLALAGCGDSPSSPSGTPSDGSASGFPPGETAESGWSLDSLKEPRTFSGHSGVITALALSARGHRAISYAHDKTLRVWDVETGKELHRLEVPEGMGKFAIAPDGKHFVCAGMVQTVEGSIVTTVYHLRLCDTETGKEVRRFPDVRQMFDCVTFSPDGTRVLACDGSNHPLLYDVKTGELLHTFDRGQSHSYAVAFSRDGKRAMAGSGNKVAVFDVENRKGLGEFTESNNVPVALAFSPDGSKALSGGFDNTVRLWDVATQKEERTFTGHKAKVTGVAFLPDGRHAVSGSSDGSIRFWDLQTGKEVNSLKDRLDIHSPLVVSADGKWLLFGGKDFAVRLEKVPELP